MLIAAGTAPWAVAFYVATAVLVLAVMLGVPALLGQRHKGRTTGERYESGLPPAGGLPKRFSISFYLVAILFVVFDLEAAFIFAWVTAAREAGWTGYIEMTVFVVLLLAGLVYLWATGALDWRARGGGERAPRGRR